MRQIYEYYSILPRKHDIILFLLLSTSEMEMIQAGSGWGCALAIGSFVGSSVALAGTGASVVFAGLGIALWYGSILGLAACA